MWIKEKRNTLPNAKGVKYLDTIYGVDVYVYNPRILNKRNQKLLASKTACGTTYNGCAYVADDLNPDEFRFTVYHEVAHILYNHRDIHARGYYLGGPIIRNENNTYSDVLAEIQCNMFALKEMNMTFVEMVYIRDNLPLEYIDLLEEYVNENKTVFNPVEHPELLKKTPTSSDTVKANTADETESRHSATSPSISFYI